MEDARLLDDSSSGVHSHSLTAPQSATEGSPSRCIACDDPQRIRRIITRLQRDIRDLQDILDCHEVSEENLNDTALPTSVRTSRLERFRRRLSSLIPARVKQNFLLIAASWYALLLVPLLFTQETSYEDLRDTIAVDTMFLLAAVFQFGLMIFIVFVSVEFVIEITADRQVSALFLMESYLSTVLLFASYYFLIFRIFPEKMITPLPPWYESVDEYRLKWSSFEVFETWVKAVYFSVTVMTTEGFGDIVPLAWWTMILVTLQQLVGMTYTSLILAKGFSLLLNPHRREQAPSRPLRRVRSCEFEMRPRVRQAADEPIPDETGLYAKDGTENA